MQREDSDFPEVGTIKLSQMMTIPMLLALTLLALYIHPF